jgi:hypothetical protein
MVEEISDAEGGGGRSEETQTHLKAINYHPPLSKLHKPTKSFIPIAR